MRRPAGGYGHDVAHEPESEGRADDSEMSEVLEGGIEVVGSLPGAAVGFLIAGPPGGVVGAAVTPVMTRALKAAVGAGLAWRARDRAAAAAILIAGARRERADRGEHPRNDGFFDARGELRPEAEELLEGVLREAAQTYEERKVPLLAALYSNVEHDASVPGPDALLLLRRAAELTYRQLVALSVFEQAERYADDLIQIQVLHTETNGHPGGDETIEMELSDLASQHLLGTLATSGATVPLAATWGGVGNIPAQVGYGQLRLLPIAETLCRLTAARDLIPDEERAAWLDSLRGPSDW